METKKKLETRKEKQETNSRREQFMLYAPLFIWIGVIFFLSTGQGSMSQTSRIIRPILEFLFPAASEETLLVYHGLIRKLAHLIEYSILGFLAFRAFLHLRRRSGQLIGAVAAAFVVIIVATIDEFNQSFNPSRTGSSTDVLIDVSGGLAVILLCYLFLDRKKELRV
jgi:VanZ family protein